MFILYIDRKDLLQYQIVVALLSELLSKKDPDSIYSSDREKGYRVYLLFHHFDEMNVGK